MDRTLGVENYSLIERGLESLSKGLLEVGEKREIAITEFLSCLLTIILEAEVKDNNEIEVITTCAQLLARTPLPKEVPSLYRHFINTPELAQKTADHFENLFRIYSQRLSFFSFIKQCLIVSWKQRKSNNKLKPRLSNSWYEILAKSTELLNKGDASSLAWGDLYVSALNLSYEKKTHHG